jgi:hypothetical protein
MATQPDLWETVRMEKKPELKKISATIYGCTICKDWTVTMDPKPRKNTKAWERRLDKHFADHLRQRHSRDEVTSEGR